MNCCSGSDEIDDRFGSSAMGVQRSDGQQRRGEVNRKLMALSCDGGGASITGCDETSGDDERGSSEDAGDLASLWLGLPETKWQRTLASMVKVQLAGFGFGLPWSGDGEQQRCTGCDLGNPREGSARAER
ncbi:hypothetical protein M0R45_017944 [Rubus argutus]|uniref:Uncharacterized protein n=1 Tax=Rubus argutus TaxID=59490 RepID=A0AAW1XZX1_RUBAR